MAGGGARMFSLLLLVALSLLASSRKAQEIYTQLDQLNAHHHNVETRLRRLRSDVHLSGIFVRDYLLDTERERGPEYRQRLPSSVRPTWRPSPSSAPLAPATTIRFSSLQTKLDEYWQTFDPLFDWTPSEKIFRSARFLRREVVPRRDAVLAIAQEIEQLNNANLGRAARRGHPSPGRVSRGSRTGCCGAACLLGLGVALVGRLPAARAGAALGGAACVAEEAERQMRQLSQQLVAAQEEERKKLSRELHDHVGADADRAAHGARPHRPHARRPPTRSSPPRSPNAGSSSTAWCAPCATSRSACVRACSTTSACSRRSNGTCATSRGGTASTSS